MKSILFLFVLFFTTFVDASVKNEDVRYADIKYTDFIVKQMEIIEHINEANQTQEQIESLLEEQNKLYEKTLVEIMANKSAFVKSLELYDKEIYALKKIMSANKRAGNDYALLRDEVAVKIYTMLRNQNIMMKNVLFSLEAPTLNDYQEALHKEVSNYLQKLHELQDKEYDSYLKIQSDSALLSKLKKNIQDYYDLYEFSGDLVSYLYKFEKKMYSLDKYSRYKLIPFVNFLNDFELTQQINDFLYEYGLSVMKILVMLFLSLLIHVFRKLLFYAIERFVVEISLLKRYKPVILDSLKAPIEFLIVLININMILFVFNSYSTNDTISMLFNIFYTLVVTYIFYKALNSIAQVKLCDLESTQEKMKNDLINVGIKIVNFLIFVVGLLVVLYFAGVNLTAVLSGLGIGGIAVAFAAKDTLSNFFGTLSILGSDVFSQGDWVEVNGKEGVVVEIGLRVTTLRTFDNALIAIPNGTFANADVKNWNKRTLGRRIKMNIGVKYSSKAQDIQNALKQIKEMLENHPDIATKDTRHEHKTTQMTKLVSKDDLEGIKKLLMVNLDEFASSSINILIYCFSRTVVWNEWLDTKEDIMYKIMDILDENNLEFAFPSLSLYSEHRDHKTIT